MENQNNVKEDRNILIFAAQKELKNELKDLLKDEMLIKAKDLFTMENISNTVGSLQMKIDDFNLEFENKEQLDQINSNMLELDTLLKKSEKISEDFRAYFIVNDDVENLNFNYDDVVQSLGANQTELMPSLKGDNYKDISSNLFSTGLSTDSSLMMTTNYIDTVNKSIGGDPMTAAATVAVSKASDLIEKIENIFKKKDEDLITKSTNTNMQGV